MDSRRPPKRRKVEESQIAPRIEEAPITKLKKHEGHNKTRASHPRSDPVHNGVNSHSVDSRSSVGEY